MKLRTTQRSEHVMNSPVESEKRSYQSLYEDFDSPLMRKLRDEAYGEDIGQHSWVTAEDLRRDVSRLKLTANGRLLDLGCGPCGPLTFIMKSAGCSGIGLDLSAAAIAAGRRRAADLGVEHRLAVQQADLDAQLSLATGTVDAVISLDVILHLRDRLRAFADIARVLAPGGRFLFTDAGIVTGSISSEEVALRSMHGFAQFCAPGFNERTLEQAGLTLLETEDRTQGMLRNAEGRLVARVNAQAEVERLEGVEGFARYQAYLRSVVATAERGALSRLMYLAEVRAG
jgi:SAM-dependent methyltransferase